MALYLAKRACGLAIVLMVMSFIVFLLQSVIPSDPARAMAGPYAPSSTIETVREEFGLNDPIAVQYGHFLVRVSAGDLGKSVRTRQPVGDDLLRYLPATLELILVSTILAMGLAFSLILLLLSGARSQVLRHVFIALGSTPIILLAVLLAYVFWFSLAWLPGSGRLQFRDFVGTTGFYVIDGLLAGRPNVSVDALAHLTLPAMALALPFAVAVVRSLAGSLHDVMRQPYIRTARGNGLSEAAIVLRHGIRNAASAPLAMTGLQIRLLFGNLLVVETVFGWPGLGLYMTQSFATADLPAILGVSMVFGTIYILVSIAVEIAQSLADPRIEL
ncbi:ABC transporter permease [Ensifer sp. IC3342]|nr:ABC transporter permease [Ensifer sp. BRP08]MCA1449956.1 ABC transporter permease [Ensifer sp. IC3342]